MGLCRSHGLSTGLDSLRSDMGTLGQPSSKPRRWQSTASTRRVGHEHRLHRHCAVLGRVLSGSLTAARSGRVRARLANRGARFGRPPFCSKFPFRERATLWGGANYRQPDGQIFLAILSAD